MKLLHKANEKARKMKKAFCFNICSRHSLWQNVSMSDLRISKLPRTKKGNLGEHFSASAYGLGFKNFSLGSLFSTSVTWKNLKSDGQILPQTWREQISKQNTITKKEASIFNTNVFTTNPSFYLILLDQFDFSDRFLSIDNVTRCNQFCLFF